MNLKIVPQKPEQLFNISEEGYFFWIIKLIKGKKLNLARIYLYNSVGLISLFCLLICELKSVVQDVPKVCLWINNINIIHFIQIVVADTQFIYVAFTQGSLL